MVPVHRFGRSRIVSAPPAARTDHGLFKARTPARPEGASFGAAGLITGGVVYLGAPRPPYARFDRRGYAIDGSVSTFTSAGFPDANARSSAGRSSSGDR